jgi:hypothetical protein
MYPGRRLRLWREIWPVNCWLRAEQGGDICERSPMDARGQVLYQRSLVRSGDVALVLCEAVLGKLVV